MLEHSKTVDIICFFCYKHIVSLWNFFVFFRKGSAMSSKKSDRLLPISAKETEEEQHKYGDGDTCVSSVRAELIVNGTVRPEEEERAHHEKCPTCLSRLEAAKRRSS